MSHDNLIYTAETHMDSLNKSVQSCYVFAALVFGLSLAVGVATHEGHPLLIVMGGLFLLIMYTPERIKSHNERVQRLIEEVKTPNASNTIHNMNVSMLTQETQKGILQVAIFG